MKRLLILFVVLAMLLCSAGCQQADSTKVPVQSISMILGYSPLALVDRFSGIIVVSNEVKIEKDSSNTIAECFVNEGDMVEAGQILFSYDLDAMKLELEKAKLEIAKLENQIATLEDQIVKLEKEKEKASSQYQLSYTLEIQTAQTDLREANYNLGIKKKAYELQEASLGESEVVAPISGRVQSINENGATDNYGRPLPYMTILETGNYRVKGTVNEMNSAAIMEGMEVVIYSRVSNETWNGVISMIDWSSPESSDDGYSYGKDEMGSSSKYPFYVELENTEGLLIGQHVYIEPASEQQSENTLSLPSYFICDADTDKPYVWAANNRDKLEKRTVVLGEYLDYLDAYVISEGLSFEDSVAVPNEEWKPGMKVSYYSDDQFSDGNSGMDMPMEVMPGVGSIGGVGK